MICWAGRRSTFEVHRPVEHHSRPASSERSASELIVLGENVVLVRAEITVEPSLNVAIDENHIAPQVMPAGGLFLRHVLLPSRGRVRRKGDNLGEIPPSRFSPGLLGNAGVAQQPELRRPSDFAELATVQRPYAADTR